jgi:hypothetical protein
MAINLPDSEILFRTWALDQSIITDIVGTRIATRLPSNATLPFAVINLDSSMAENINSAPMWLAMIDVDCYGGKYGSDGTKATPDFAGAFSLANAFVRCAFDFTPKKYSITGTDGIIHGFNPIDGPSRLETTDNDLARYNISVGMYYGAAE